MPGANVWAHGEQIGRGGFRHAKAGKHLNTLTHSQLGESMEAIPNHLGESRAGEHESLHPLKKSLRQGFVFLHGGDNFFEPLGYIKVHGRRYFAQIPQRAHNALSRGFAVINVKRAPVIEHDPDIMIASKDMVPRQPIHQYRRLGFHETHDLQNHLLVGTPHPLSDGHALGRFSRA